MLSRFKRSREKVISLTVDSIVRQILNSNEQFDHSESVLILNSVTSKILEIKEQKLIDTLDELKQIDNAIKSIVV